jgi:GAF domain-containing protein
MELIERKYYTSLYQVAAAVNSVHAPETVLQSIVESVAKVLGAKGCSLMELTPDGKLLLHTAACGLSDWYVRKGPLSADRSVSEALEGRPVAVFDATTDARIQYRKQAEKEGIASILSVPMALRDQVIGVVRVYTSEPREFSSDDIYFVEAVANLGAIALENARLYESVKKDHDQFCQDMLEWRAARWKPWMRM